MTALGELGTTRWLMPGQVFPPEGFGPWAIAGERLTAATRVRAVAPHHKAFISDLRWMNVSVASRWSARLRRSGDQRWAPLARPARQTGRSAYPVDTAPVLSMELCLPGSGGGVASRDAMSELTEAGGNARWLLSRCFRCIAAGSPDAHRIRGPLGIQAAR